MAKLSATVNNFGLSLSSYLTQGEPGWHRNLTLASAAVNTTRWHVQTVSSIYMLNAFLVTSASVKYDFTLCNFKVIYKPYHTNAILNGSSAHPLPIETHRTQWRRKTRIWTFLCIISIDTGHSGAGKWLIFTQDAHQSYLVLMDARLGSGRYANPPNLVYNVWVREGWAYPFRFGVVKPSKANSFTC